VEDYLARVGSSALVPALVNPSETWFDGDVAGSRDALLAAALARAVDESAPSEPPEAGVTFAHPLGITERSRSRFSVGPFPVPGYETTVLSISRARAGLVTGPSVRAILDPGDWDRSVATNAPGQSGAPGSPHFDDLARPWAEGDYFPLAFSDAAVQEHAESTLLLMPR
jgi:penicillin amidase